MKLANILKTVTSISEDSSINLRNYMKSVSYISNLYKFHSKIKDVIPTSEFTYLPSFKDCYLAEELGIATITEENELRLLVIQSPLFLVDTESEKVKDELDSICTTIIHEKDIMTFYLK